MFNLVNHKSLIAPHYYEARLDCIRMGNKYQRVYLITQFPEEFSFGVLHYAFRDPAVKLFYVTRLVKESMVKPLNDEVARLKRKYRDEKEEVGRSTIVKRMKLLQETINELVYSKDRSVDVLMGFIVSSDDEETLKDTCDLFTNTLSANYQFGFDEITGLQEEIFKSIIPLWKQTGLTKDLDYRYRIPLSSVSAAILWPFRYDEMIDKNGMLLGYTTHSNGIVKFNPFLWEDDASSAASKQITAGSIIIEGQTGSGKTQTINKFARYFLRRGIPFIWIDPHNQNAKIVKKYHGRYILFGTADAKINPLDLRLQDFLDDDAMYGKDPYDTDLAKKDAIRTFKTVVKLYHRSNLAEVEKALNVVDEIIMHTYERKGITAPSFKVYSNQDYPIISDVLEDIKKAIEIRKAQNLPDDAVLKQLINLELYIEPLVQADGIYFNGHTTADFESENDLLLGFGTKKLDSCDKNIKEPVYHLIMRLFESHLYDASRKCAGIWDEFQKVALNGYLLPKCSDAFRSVRKYHSILVLGMQEPGDLASSVMVDGAAASSYGEAIMNNATYKIILMLQEQALKKAASMLDLSDDEIDLIKNFRTGQALFLRGNNERYVMNIYASKAEIDELKL